MTQMNEETGDDTHGVNVEDEGVDVQNDVTAKEDVSVYSCGIAGCRPSCIQICNNNKMFLFAISMFMFANRFRNGVNKVNTVAYEKRFGLSSEESALVSSAFDISAAIFVLPISYLGARAHKPVMLSVTCVILGIGCLVMALPQFISSPYDYRGSSNSDTCNLAVFTNSCVEGTSSDVSNTKGYIGYLITGQLLNGIAGTTLYTVGLAMIDENTEERYVPVYIGIFFGTNGFATMLGFVIGGLFKSDLFVDFNRVDPAMITISEGDQSWVGAWWLGLLIAAGLAFPVAVMLWAFPSRLSSYNAKIDDNSFATPIKDFPKVTWSLLRNLPYLFICLAAAAEFLVTEGLMTYLSKFIANQYNQPEFFADVFAGVVAVFGAMFGQILGGVISSKLKLDVKGMLTLCIIACGCAIVCGIVLIAKCEMEPTAGVNRNYDDISAIRDRINLTSTCNRDCDCTSERYIPICGSNNVQYFSPCHAGCLSETYPEYSNCSCIASALSSEINSIVDATDGKCEGTCWALYLFIPIFFLSVLFNLITASPGSVIILRLVPHQHRSFAMGIYFVFSRFLGAVPGPRLFGKVIDDSCLIWKQKCNENQSCWIYKKDVMGYSMLWLSATVKACAALFFSLSLISYTYIERRNRSSAKDHDNAVPHVIEVNVAGKASLAKYNDKSVNHVAEGNEKDEENQDTKL